MVVFCQTTIRGWRTCDVEFLPYYVLGDLWESFKEWSAYGAGVPLVLNEGDSAVQYYVPYLSGIQLYGDSSKASVKTRYIFACFFPSMFKISFCYSWCSQCFWPYELKVSIPYTEGACFCIIFGFLCTP